MFLWHFPAGRPARPLAGIAALWSPDFPLREQVAQRPPGELLFHEIIPHGQTTKEKPLSADNKAYAKV